MELIGYTFAGSFPTYCAFYTASSQWITFVWYFTSARYQWVPVLTSPGNLQEMQILETSPKQLWRWKLRNWCFQILVLEKTPESFLGSKEIKTVNPNRSWPWIFIEKTDAEVSASILWPPDAKRQLIRKDSDARKDREHKEKGVTEDEMIRWHHRLNGHEFEQTPGDSEGREAWHATVHGVTKNLTWLSD